MPENEFIEEVEVPVDPEDNDETIEVEDTFDTDVNVDTDVPENVVVKEYLSDITIGDVETLDYGEDAYVTNSGTADHPVLDFGLPRGASGTIWGQLDGTLSDQTDLQNALDAINTSVSGKADLASPAFTGTPTAPTAIADTNSNQLATTAFVKNALAILENKMISRINKMLGRIDFSSPVQSTLSAKTPPPSGQVKSYTCPLDGYVFIVANTGPTTAYLAINDSKITKNEITNAAGIHYVPVSAGDICTAGGAGAGAYAAITIVFFPQKVEA